MRFRELLAAAEQARHLVVPASERTVGGAIQVSGIETQDRLELVSDRRAVSDPLPQTERFGERAHVCRDPEMSLWPVRVQADRLPARVDALLVGRAALPLRNVATEPIVG